jgi:hypothetical protein
MKADRDFPRLTPRNHYVTSPATADYNCVAWAAGDTEHWWQPGVYWPADAPPQDFGISALEGAFRALGFEPCDDDAPDPGLERVALYSKDQFYTHAARQLPGGNWTSKLGKGEDIEHDTPDVIAGGLYGEVARIMRRPSGNDASSPPSI